MSLIVFSLLSWVNIFAGRKSYSQPKRDPPAWRIALPVTCQGNVARRAKVPFEPSKSSLSHFQKGHGRRRSSKPQPSNWKGSLRYLDDVVRLPRSGLELQAGHDPHPIATEAVLRIYLRQPFCLDREIVLLCLVDQSDHWANTDIGTFKAAETGA
jgi:hypothetical protein